MPDFWTTIGNTIWYVLLAFFFVTYLMAFFNVISDLFRDRELSGVARVIWVLLLIFLPLASVLAYMIFRGRGMAERANQQLEQNRKAADDYIRDVARYSPAEEIAKAKALLDSGTITAKEYEGLKTTALATR